MCIISELFVIITGIIVICRLLPAIRKQYDINDYFFCSKSNGINMRIKRKYVKNDENNNYSYHCKHLYDGFDKLEINKLYNCKSHGQTLRYLQLLARKKYVVITLKKRSFLKGYKIPIYEYFLGKPNITFRNCKMYTINFVVLKTLPKDVVTYKKLYSSCLAGKTKVQGRF